MKRLIVCVLAIWFAFCYGGCVIKESSTSNQPTLEVSTDTVATPVQIPAHVVDTMDSGYTMGTLIGNRYYVSAYGNHTSAFSNFKRVAAILESKGWKMVPESFRGMYNGSFMFIGSFVKNDKPEESVIDMTGLPPELIMGNGQGR